MKLPRSCGGWGIQGLKKDTGIPCIIRNYLLTPGTRKYQAPEKHHLSDDIMPVTYLFPRPPYDFSLSAAIFDRGDPQVRTFFQGTFRQALDTGEKPVLVEVCSKGSVNSPKLCLSIRSDNPLSKSEIKKVNGLISSMLSIVDDLEPFYTAMESDPIMTALVQRLRGVKSPTTPTVFEALTDSVIEQQISLAAAHSIEHRLIRAVGTPLIIDNATWYCYPTPQILAKTTDATFRACGLTLRKGEYIRDISRHIVEGTLDLDHFKTYPDTESIISEMVKVRGIGRWTAELTILRGLQRADSFPADDVGVRRFISRVYYNGKKISPDEARAFADIWGPWKGFAAYYLEVADMLGLIPWE
jgi:DNA-3-methyladenine glycosylase II